MAVFWNLFVFYIGPPINSIQVPYNIFWSTKSLGINKKGGKELFSKKGGEDFMEKIGGWGLFSGKFSVKSRAVFWLPLPPRGGGVNVTHTGTRGYGVI